MQASPILSRESAPEATAPRPSRARAPRPDPLVREVTAVLLIKLIAILVLWLAFFRHGDVPRPASTAQAVAQHIAAPLPEVPVAAH